MEALSCSEVTTFYDGLTRQQREELLQCILIASTVSWWQVRHVIESTVFVHLVERDLEAL